MGTINGGGVGLGLYQRGVGKTGQGQGQGTDSRRSSFDVEDALDIDDDDLMEG